MLIIQIALGIVIVVVLLAALPYLICMAYIALKNIAIGVGSVVLVFGGTLLLYGLFYLGWYVATAYIPKVILVVSTVASVLSLLALVAVAIKQKLPVPGNIWFLLVVLCGLSILVFSSAYESYQKYSELGNELNYVSPFFMFLAVLGWSVLLLFKKRQLGHTSKP
ncbi:hypothetical protein [Marinobacter sp. ELB17]|uniref:hypothetical protein n=1 Tax=Marinobacter sp. ELB17 TaxID=270374 RepID=UPI0000F36BCE|nr:hypothetical protein [Marinobacter sp. ELB17]EAZ97068.1 hypothetical protein MELB17_05524 [Marinobacter sp. ELB17]